MLSLLTKQAPCIESFTIFIYHDKHYLSNMSTIQIFVSSYRCTDMTLTLGQNTTQYLYLPPMNAELCRFKTVSSSRCTVFFNPPYNHAFNPSQTNVTSVEYSLMCKEVGSNIKVLLHLIGEDTKNMKYTQMLNINLSMPDISKQYRIPTANENKNIKFAYENQKGLSFT